MRESTDVCILCKKQVNFWVERGIMINRGSNGSVSEWLMEADCKSAGYAYASSNLARPTTLIVDFGLTRNLKSKTLCPCSSVVEHFIGNEEVTSSILVMGF